MYIHLAGFVIDLIMSFDNFLKTDQLTSGRNQISSKQAVKGK